MTSMSLPFDESPTKNPVEATARMQTLDLIAVGDISLARSNGRMPFEHVVRYLRTGDIVFGNLECVLCDPGRSAQKEITFRAPPARVEYLRQAGFTIVNLANNHTLDFGPMGLTQTCSVLREQGIPFIGVGGGNPADGHQIVERRGVKVGFLGYGEADACKVRGDVSVNSIHCRTILDHLHYLRPRCDVLIVSLHWGLEYVRYPSPDQVELARTLAAEGVNLVLGHHPHVVQGVERVGSSLIVYSLGSFHIRPLRGEGTRESCMLHVRINRRGIDRYRLIPVQLDDADLPHVVRGHTRRKISRLIGEISAPIREGRITENWWFKQAAPIYLSGHLAAWMKRIRQYGPRHFVQFVRWLVSGFTVKCYLGYLRKRVGRHG